MAIGTPIELARNHSSAAVSTLVLTLGAAVSAGDLILVVSVNHNTTTVVPSGVVDSGGVNAYTPVTVANSGGSGAMLAYCGNAGALAINDTITITWPSTRNVAAIAYKVSGAATAPFDVSATNPGASSTSLTTTATATTAQANELVMACFTWSGTRTFTGDVANGYTAGTKEESVTTIRGVCAEWKVVSATGAQTALGTLNSASAYCGIVATFKEGGASTFTEAGEGDAITTGTAADTATFTDAGSGAQIAVGSGADALTTAEAGGGATAAAGSGADMQATTEVGQATAALAASGLDAPLFTDAGAGVGILVASGADSAAFTDAATALMALAGSGADTFSGGTVYDEAGSGASATVASGAETYAMSDAASAVAALFGTGVDTALMIDSGTGVLIAAGSGADALGGAVSRYVAAALGPRPAYALGVRSTFAVHGAPARTYGARSSYTVAAPPAQEID